MYLPEDLVLSYQYHLSTAMADKPPVMDWSSHNIPESFRLFKQRMELYFTIKSFKPEEKVATILLASGEEGLKRFNGWDLTAEEKADANIIWKKFLDQIEPADNFRISRLKLSTLRQRSDESLDDFISRCKHLANKCDFSKDELQQRLIEIIIAATPIAEFQKDLLAKPKSFTLEETLQLGRSYEASKAHITALKSMDQHPTSTMDMLHMSRTKHHKSKKSTCKNCGKDHQHNKDQCPAAKSTCGSCGKIGHWAKYCLTTKFRQRSKSKNRQRTHQYQNHQKGFHAIDNQTSECEMDDMNNQLESFSFHGIEDANSDRNEAFATLQIQLDTRPGIHNFTLKIDTGAQANTIPLRVYRQMYPDRVDNNGDPESQFLSPSNTTLTAYNGTHIKCHGITELTCRYKNKNWQKAQFFVVDVPGPAVFGLPSSENFKIVSLNCSVQSKSAVISGSTSITNINDLKDMYPLQFDRIGELRTEHSLVVDPNVPAHISPPRKVPIAMKDKIKSELSKMCDQNVIKKIEEPTNWVSSITYVTKRDGGLRICLDPKHLNKALLRPYHKIPTLEEINHRFAKAKFFSKLDAKAGYWSIKLHPDSQQLTTFQTPFGRYCYQRLPMGLSVSQDIYQMEMDRLLEKCTGACGIADDIIIYGSSEEEHDENLINFMNVAKQEGLVLNSEKCIIKSKEVSFFGHVYTENGIKPDPIKIKDLQNMPTPTSKTELQHFLGFITYLSKFIPEFSQKTAVLRDLLSKDAIFLWEAHHQKAFCALKTEVSENSVLNYYDPNQPVELQCDASLRGIGAALLQPDLQGNMKPVAFASKSLTQTEQRYACIERELLAIVFGTQRFHTYLFGRHFNIVTDHRPLLMIASKPITAAPPRLQRMLILLNGYNFSLSHRPGTENQLADGLSRLPNTANQCNVDLDIRVDMINFSTDRINIIKEHSLNDPTLLGLQANIVNGWPDKLQEVTPNLRSYWAFRDQLSIENGLILKGQQIIIPASQQREILKQLHTAHLGIEKTKLLARDTVYWIGINKDIHKLISECKICQEHQRAQTPEPLQQHDIPQRPWSVLATDIFEFHHHQYLIIADYYTKFPVIKKLPHPAPSSIVVDKTKEVFSEFGIPDKIVSDNGPHFASQTYSEFAKQWQFNHVTTSPRRPQGNGFIERQIQTIKGILKKAKQSNTDPYLAILHWRSTPITTKLGSPAQLLMSRQFKTTIPSRIHGNYEQDSEDIHEALQQRQMSQKYYFDQHALPNQLPSLYIGQPVRIRHPETGQWFPATVFDTTNDPKSYILKDMNGQCIRRNRQHIRDIPVTSAITPDESFSTSPLKPYINQDPKHVTFKEPVVHKETHVDQPIKTRSGRTIVKPTRFSDSLCTQ